jgi:Common central domain of tyrosinase/Polyphenol oxidase middle domain
MQARPVSDPTSWAYQAAIHGTYRTPEQANWNGCQHQGWFFLPWHRMYLYYFEKIVRKAVLDAGGPADFAIPYWNYDRPSPGNTIPRAFRTPTLPDGSANPLHLPAPKRSAGVMAGGQVPATATTSTAAMAATNFSAPSGLTSFGGTRVGPDQFAGGFGALENTPHNAMHPTIGGPSSGQCAGGLMTDPNCAAIDPIFWLHHANIDRIWNVWLAAGGGRANPTESSWLSQSFGFFDETGAQVTLSCADVVDSAAQLGYVYDDAVQLRAAPPVRIPRMSRPLPPRPPELVAATEEPLDLTGTTASVSLTVPASTRGLLEKPTAAAGDERTGRVFVNVDDIEADRDPGLAYAVYLTAPGKDEGEAERYHIGNVALFGIEKMNDPDKPHDGAPGFRHVFEATDAVRSLEAEGRWDPDAVNVIFEPIVVLPPPGAEPAIAEPSEPVPPVRIGRVSVFVA